MSVPIKMNGIDEIWTRISEMKWIEVKWVIWRIWLCEPYEKVPISRLRVSLSKWLDLFVVTKSYQNEWNRWEMSELSEMKWNEWFDGFDFVNPMRVTWVNPMGISLWVENECPYQFDLIDLSEKALCSVEWMSLWEWLGTTLWESPYGRLRVSLWKWLEWTLWESPYQNEWIQWDLIELKWIEWNEVKWVNWRKWARTTPWESPYGRKKVSLWEWLDVCENESPYQNEWNRWEMNEVKWIEWNEVKWVIWWIWLGTTLWESPYGQ